MLRENADCEAGSGGEMIGEQQRPSGSVETCAHCIICPDIATGPFHRHIEPEKTAAIHSGTGMRSVVSPAQTDVLLGDLEREKQLTVAARTATTG